MLTRRLLLSSIRKSLPASNIILESSSCYNNKCRLFGSVAVPIPKHGRDPDNVYRRPEVPAPNKPLSEEDELLWDDGQAPEPALDAYTEINEYKALKQLLFALTGTITIAVAGAVYLNPTAKNPVIPQQFPFDNLRLELGGSAIKDSGKSSQPIHPTTQSTKTPSS